MHANSGPWTPAVMHASPLPCLSAQLPHNIRALACKGELTFAAVRGDIVACRRMHRCPIGSIFTAAYQKLVQQL